MTPSELSPEFIYENGAPDGLGGGAAQIGKATCALRGHPILCDNHRLGEIPSLLSFSIIILL